MPQARQFFLKSTITLALTAAGCQVAATQKYIGDDDEGFISLVKTKSIAPAVPMHVIETKAEQDITIALASYPGVYVTTLLPNSRFSQISAGGSMPFGRSGVAIVEDGINYAPLPYLDNSLINISMASVESIQVLELAQAAIGPNGLGGIINITREQIPSSGSDGMLELGYGTHEQSLIDLDFGRQQKSWGSFFSFNRQQGDSYRVNKNQQSGDYSANDFMLRIKEIAPRLNGNWQQTELKLQYKDYQNDESRFGISRDDLATKPMLRYVATALDNEEQEQLHIHLKHHARLDNDELVITDTYYNDGTAGYYQTIGVNGLSGNDAARALGLFEQMAIGSAGIEKQGVDRGYSSWGIQFKVEQQVERHNISLGVRYHTESLTEQLWSDLFSMDSQLTLNKLDTGSDIASYKDTARVRSIFLSEQWQSGRWDINLGLRHEKIKMRREHTNLVNDGLGESKQSITLLNGAANYNISDNWRLIFSGHQGYQPSHSSTRVVKAQESLIVRGGISYGSTNLTASALVFTNTFDNLLGVCQGAAACINGKQNVGSARVSGAELTIKAQGQFGGYYLPVWLSYTHNGGEFSRDYDSSSLWGAINNGDLLPLVPRNQFYANIGLANGRWQVNAQVRYRDVQRTTPGIAYDNSAETLDDVTLLSLNASYQVAKSQHFYLTVNNLTDAVYAESSFHAGVLAGSERTISVNYKWTF